MESSRSVIFESNPGSVIFALTDESSANVLLTASWTPDTVSFSCVEISSGTTMEAVVEVTSVAVEVFTGVLVLDFSVVDVDVVSAAPLPRR